MLWRIGYPHSACLKVLVLRALCVDAPSSDLCLEKMDEMACTLEKEGSKKTYHPH
jgi:hypothetical protein